MLALCAPAGDGPRTRHHPGHVCPQARPAPARRGASSLRQHPLPGRHPGSHTVVYVAYDMRCMILFRVEHLLYVACNIQYTPEATYNRPGILYVAPGDSAPLAAGSSTEVEYPVAWLATLRGSGASPGVSAGIPKSSLPCPLLTLGLPLPPSPCAADPPGLQIEGRHRVYHTCAIVLPNCPPVPSLPCAADPPGLQLSQPQPVAYLPGGSPRVYQYALPCLSLFSCLPHSPSCLCAADPTRPATSPAPACAGRTCGGPTCCPPAVSPCCNLPAGSCASPSPVPPAPLPLSADWAVVLALPASLPLAVSSEFGGATSTPPASRVLCRPTSGWGTSSSSSGPATPPPVRTQSQYSTVLFGGYYQHAFSIESIMQANFWLGHVQFFKWASRPHRRGRRWHTAVKYGTVCAVQ